jgi:hypothetical protein
LSKDHLMAMLRANPKAGAFQLKVSFLTVDWVVWALNSFFFFSSVLKMGKVNAEGEMESVTNIHESFLNSNQLQ